jgi:hypothetical protein
MVRASVGSVASDMSLRRELFGLPDEWERSVSVMSGASEAQAGALSRQLPVRDSLTPSQGPSECPVPSARTAVAARVTRVLVCLVIPVTILAGGCTTAGTGAGVGATTGTSAPLPAGVHPSKISKEVCSTTAQHEMTDALGEKPVVSTPTWVRHRYSCRYQYANGSFVLSVKELSSWSQTKAYFRMLGSELGDVTALANLGQAAFQTRDGSVVVRKDWKVLLVDNSDLPARFGVPTSPKADISVTVADVILGCWAGD